MGLHDQLLRMPIERRFTSGRLFRGERRSTAFSRGPRRQTRPDRSSNTRRRPGRQPPTILPRVTGTRLWTIPDNVISGGVETVWNLAHDGHQPGQWQEIHVGHAVLEAGRDERRDRQYESDDLVGDRPPGIGKPNRQADKHVAQDAFDEECQDVRLNLGDGRVQYRQADAAAVHVEVMGKKDQDDKSKRTYQIAEVDDEPVAQHLSGGDFPAGPRHHDQVVARKQLGASDDHERQAERKHQAAEYADRSEAQLRVAGDDGVVERPEPDAAARHDRKHERREERQSRLLDPDFFDGFLDLGGTVGIRIEDGRLRRGCSVIHPASPP